MRRSLLLVFFVWLATMAMAQSRGRLQVCVVDSLSREPIIGAVATFERAHETPLYGASNVQGEIDESLPYGKYQLTVTSIGYDSLRVDFRLSKALLRLDTLRMRSRAEVIDNVVVEATAMRTAQRGDTLIYNASAFKTAFGADAGAMLQKMPGIEVLDNGLETQGRTIHRVYVDGREFFGTDVMAAIRNIPSDMIQSVEVYNAQSDESEMSGIDLGDGQMALNIVTRPDKRHGAFGRLYGAYGIKDKYIGGGNANIFHDEQRLTLVGMANNIGRRNFSYENILGTTDSESRSAGKEFAVNEFPGIADVQAFGLNFNDQWGKRGKITATYFFNRTDNHNENDTESLNFSTSDRATGYTDRNITDRLNAFHRFNSRIDYSFNRQHQLRVRLNLNATDNKQYADLFRRTNYHYTDGNSEFVNYRRNFANQKSDYAQGGASISYTYRLKAKRLRSFNVTASGTLRKNDFCSNPQQYTFYEEEIEPDTADYGARTIRMIDRAVPSYSYSLSASYTHAFSRRSRMNISYLHSDAVTDYTNTVFQLNNKTNQYPEDRHKKESSEYDYSYTTDRVGATYQYSKKKTRMAGTLYYQHVEYRSQYSFPYEARTRASFDNLAYAVVGNIQLNKRNRIRIDANSRTSNPSAGDLQAVVNTNNRQHVFAGNPNLEPVYTHRFTGEYVRTSAQKGRTFTLSLQYVSSPNSVVDSLVVDNPDFVIDDEGTKLGKGNQYAKPINASGFRTIRLVTTCGVPVRWLRSNLNFRLDVSSNRRPSIINDMWSHLNNDYAAGTVTLSSNISENVDFTLSYMGRYQNNTTASRGMTLDNTFYRQRIRGDLTVVLGERWVMRANGIYNSYRGITDSFHEERLLLNATVGVRVFKNRLGELSVGVNDLLDENSSTFSRWASGTTLKSARNLAIGRFYQVQFAYYLRHYRRVKITPPEKQ